MDLLASDVPWPRHTNSEWRQTMRTARDHGWCFRPSANHIFGTLQCRDAPKGQRCQQIVFSSGRGTDNVAISTRQKIDRCPHAVSDEATPEFPMSFGQIEMFLGKAENLLRAAQACQREISHRATCKELLAEAEADLDRCDELLERAAAAESAAVESAARTARHLAAAGRSSPERDAPTLLNEAEHLVDLADSGLNGAEPVEQSRRLQERAASLRTTVSQLRSFLRI